MKVKMTLEDTAALRCVTHGYMRNEVSEVLRTIIDRLEPRVRLTALVILGETVTDDKEVNSVAAWYRDFYKEDKFSS